MSITKRVSRCAELQSQIEELTKELEKEKAFFYEDAEAIFLNTRERSVTYEGMNGECLTVTRTDKVDAVTYDGIRKMFKDKVGEYVTEETVLKLTPKFKKLVRGFATGEYEKVDFEYAIETLTEKNLTKDQVNVLKRKLKGDYIKDTSTLEAFGINEDDARDIAFLLDYAKSYTNVRTIVAPTLKEGDSLDKALDTLKPMLMVDQSYTIKISN